MSWILEKTEGMIPRKKLNATESGDSVWLHNIGQKISLYYEPLLILFRKLVADTLADSPGVLVNAAYPGICKTDIKRHMGVDKSITGNVISKPILSPLTSSAESGAKIPMVLATDPDLKGM